MLDSRWRLHLVLAVVAGPALLLGALTACTVGDEGFTIRFSQHPADITVHEGETATFSVVLDTLFTDPQTSWQRANAPNAAFTTIPGATGTVIHVGPVGIAGDHGARFRAVATGFVAGDLTGQPVTATSNAATLTVVPAVASGTYQYVRITQTSSDDANVAVNGASLLNVATGQIAYLEQVHIDPGGDAGNEAVLGPPANQCLGRPRAEWDTTTFAELLGEGSQLVASFTGLALIETGRSLSVHVCSDEQSSTWRLEVGTTPSGPWFVLLHEALDTSTVSVPNLP